MKERNDIRRSKLADLKSRRSVLNSPPKKRGCDEFKSLGQASSELIAKLSKKAKVGAERVSTQPPSKTTSWGGNNVVYLNSKSVNNLLKAHKTKKAGNQKDKGDICQLFYIFQ